MEIACNAVSEEVGSHSINTIDGIVVSNTTYLIPDMNTCPIGVKVQLLNPGGVLVYGQYDGKSKDWLAWAPLPRLRKE